jgi:hypothetical protein
MLNIQEQINRKQMIALKKLSPLKAIRERNEVQYEACKGFLGISPDIKEALQDNHESNMEVLERMYSL